MKLQRRKPTCRKGKFRSGHLYSWRNRVCLMKLELKPDDIPSGSTATSHSTAVLTTLANGNASWRFCTNISLRANHCSFSNRTLLAIHQKKEQNHEDKETNCRNNGQWQPDPRIGRVGARRDSR